MSATVANSGAQLVHPGKAFVLTHIEAPFTYRARLDWNEEYVYERYVSASNWPPRDPEVFDYLLRLQLSVETLFGSVGFDLHRPRAYDAAGLPFHQDIESGHEPGDLVRQVTCVHNLSTSDRVLAFRKPLWTGHTESFELGIPAGAILAFGESLTTGYEHGIPPGEEAASYRSVVSRFTQWTVDPVDNASD